MQSTSVGRHLNGRSVLFGVTGVEDVMVEIASLGENEALM